MRYLLDTHVLLWWLNDDITLSKKVRQIIANPDNIIFISSVGTWEIAVKKSLGKLIAPDDLEKGSVARLNGVGYNMIKNIKICHQVK